MLFAQLEQIARARLELVVVDRAAQKIGGAGLQRPQAELALLVDGDDDDGHFGKVRLRAEPAGELRAVHVGHLEIGDDEIGGVGLEPHQRGLRIREGAYRGAILDRSGKPREDLTIGGAIVEDHDERHGAAFFDRFRSDELGRAHRGAAECIGIAIAARVENLDDAP